MNISKQGIKFLIKAEGVVLSAYLDSASVWTIGTGFTFYEDGAIVKRGDVITAEQNETILRHVLNYFEKGINNSVKVELNQNQFDALISLVYNIGLGAFKKSSLLREINKDPNNPKIKDFFEMWRFATVNGVKKPILLSRRKKESKLYFT